VRIADHAGILLPGGFSYGDALGAGGRLALELRTWFADELAAFVVAGKPILGICNGFQALVKAGLLPGPAAAPRTVTLTENARGLFECRWVTLGVDVGVSSSWLASASGAVIRCPIAHGEGRVAVIDESATASLEAAGQVAFRYLNGGAAPIRQPLQAAEGVYPANPNGSVADIAGLCDSSGSVVGLMPHPEDHVFAWQRPSGPDEGSGLVVFEAFVGAAG
jgi:phosphoribosylformylglycinamidine synthase